MSALLDSLLPPQQPEVPPPAPFPLTDDQVAGTDDMAGLGPLTHADIDPPRPWLVVACVVGAAAGFAASVANPGPFFGS